MLEKLKGKKTYIVAVLAGIATSLLSLGIIDNSTYLTVMGFLNSGAIATLRAGIENK